MNDAQSTIAGLNAQDCPGGGWSGMSSDLDRATVADCLAHGVCGCIYGDAIQHIERLRATLKPFVQARKSIDHGDVRGALSVVCLNDLRRAVEALGDEQSGESK